MNIKRPLLIIIPILLLLILFFICADRRGFFKDDSSAGPISSTDGIGYMKEIDPGENDDVRDDVSPVSGVVADKQAARESRADSRRPSGAAVKRADSAGVKPASVRGIETGEREVISEKSRVPDLKTAALKDDSAVKGNQARDKISGINAAAEKKDSAAETIFADKSDAGRDAADSGSSSADKKNASASGKSESAADKSGTGEVKYSRLDRIHLYSGEVLTGTVTARGDIYTIITSAGIRRVVSKDIQGNDIVK